MHHVRVGLDRHEASRPARVPYSQTRPRSLRPRSTSITCSARSFSSASSSAAMRASSLGIGAARARAGDRPRRDVAPGDRQQRLRAGARRSGSPRSRGSTCTATGSRRAARGRSRTARPAICADQRCDGTTWKASPAWMYSMIRATIALELRARHVRLERRHRRAARGASPAAAAGPAAALATSAIVATASRVGGARRRLPRRRRRWRGS